MNMKILTVLAVFIIGVSIAGVYAAETANHDFDGLFRMDVPSSENFTNPVDEGQYSPGLSANVQYDGENFSVYYYNESNMADDFDAENITDYLPQMLKSNSVYMDDPVVEENLYVWNNTVGGSSGAAYLVGVSSDDGSQMVCIEGNNLDDLKTYAGTVEF